PHQFVSEQRYQITRVLLHVSRDLGHGGAAATYQIEPDGDGYEVRLTVSRLSPAPGERAFQPSRITQTLAKDKREVDAFLRRLGAEFNVFDWADLKSPYPFLHPTFYTFSFHDAAGRQHGFNYQIEGSHHLDAKYQALVQAFESFFQSP
ncbi:MAG: hypothetical protein M3347_11980, partial [Armatimonadota bacterium]|nr:hypothetical protein [Armatimonadota bacterium]